MDSATYTTSQVAHELSISAAYVRRLTLESGVDASHRTSGGQRRFTQADIERLRGVLEGSVVQGQCPQAQQLPGEPRAAARGDCEVGSAYAEVERCQPRAVADLVAELKGLIAACEASSGSTLQLALMRRDVFCRSLSKLEHAAIEEHVMQREEIDVRVEQACTQLQQAIDDLMDAVEEIFPPLTSKPLGRGKRKQLQLANLNRDTLLMGFPYMRLMMQAFRANDSSVRALEYLIKSYVRINLGYYSWMRPWGNDIEWQIGNLRAQRREVEKFYLSTLAQLQGALQLRTHFDLGMQAALEELSAR